MKNKYRNKLHVNRILYNSSIAFPLYRNNNSTINETILSEIIRELSSQITYGFIRIGDTFEVLTLMHLDKDTTRRVTSIKGIVKGNNENPILLFDPMEEIYRDYDYTLEALSNAERISYIVKVLKGKKKNRKPRYQLKDDNGCFIHYRISYWLKKGVQLEIWED